MIKFMLDTNICIELIRGQSERILHHLKSCKIGEVCISSITLAELEFGVSKSNNPIRNRIALAEFCAPLEILLFDDKAASAYGCLQISHQL